MPSPVFILSSIRSGSTLLRVVLDSHSQICAPHEMHLNRLRVEIGETYARRAIRELGLTTNDLENLLWDRVMHRQLLEARKSILVDKTPQNVALWPRISSAWPRARYLDLLRHPASIASSLAKASPNVSVSKHQQRVLQYAAKIEEARAHLSGLTIRYEDLTAEPEMVTHEICRWLGVHWEKDMLNYGEKQRRHARGLGDWGDNIRSGRVQPAKPQPPAHEIPTALRALSETWGY